MAEYVEIPASAWAGVGDPDPDISLDCPTCGCTDTRVLSISEMMAIPNVIDAHTFMIPGRAWGYISCPVCEAPKRRRKFLGIF